MVPSLVSVNEEFVKDLKAKAATFVLITNILDDKELSPADVLREYKNQTAVELSFRFLKNPVYVDGIYVKNPERVVAIGYVFLMALLIYALLQRRVRRNLARETKPLTIPGKRKSFSPTLKAVFTPWCEMWVIGGRVPFFQRRSCRTGALYCKNAGRNAWWKHCSI